MTEPRRHQSFPWGGGLRCLRCGARIHDAGPEGARPCDERTWASGTFELRHRAGAPDERGRQWCERCGDPVPFTGTPAGMEYVVSDQRESDGFSWSGWYATPDLETAPVCR